MLLTTVKLSGLCDASFAQTSRDEWSGAQASCVLTIVIYVVNELSFVFE